MTNPKHITVTELLNLAKGSSFGNMNRGLVAAANELDAQTEQIATLTRDLASAKARCERMEKALDAAQHLLAQAADRIELMDGVPTNGTRKLRAAADKARAALADETSVT